MRSVVIPFFLSPASQFICLIHGVQYCGPQSGPLSRSAPPLSILILSITCLLTFPSNRLFSCFQNEYQSNIIILLRMGKRSSNLIVSVMSMWMV